MYAHVENAETGPRRNQGVVGPATTTFLFLAALFGPPGSATASPAAAGAAPWERSTPEEQGIDSRDLFTVLSMIRDDELAIHSILILRNHHLLVEGYIHPYNENTLHNVASVNKSFMSALTGIALREELIDDVGQPIQELLPQSFSAEAEARNGKLTLRHLLTMTSGLEIDDSGPVGRAIFDSGDPARATLALPKIEDPGLRFAYSTALTHLMSVILTETGGRPLLDFAEEHLFGPLGITRVQWSRGPKDYYFGGGFLFLTPRAMARFGSMYLDHGRWQGLQVVPEAWVKQSTRPLVTTAGRAARIVGIEKYGYWWWVRPNGRYSALGRGGQRIDVKPDQDMVVVTTGSSSQGMRKITAALDQIALSDRPLPPNPKAAAALGLLLHEFEHPTPVTAGAPPPIAHEVSGRKYVVERSNWDWDWQHLTFDFHGKSAATLTLGWGSDTYQVAIGLDDLYRLSDVGTQGAMPEDNRLSWRGRWTGADTFSADFQLLGDPMTWDMSITFTDPRVEIVISHPHSDMMYSWSGKAT